ncbi:hypothetical protein ACLKA6_001036 [Drosophila palustris]
MIVNNYGIQKLCHTGCKMAEALIRTRQRENETKRWSDNETKRMLSYILSQKKFEKPTARVFYTKLLEETKINTKWHLARCKMRHLRALFLKANACLESTDEIVEDDNGVVTVLEKVRKICPHYDMLSDIFSHSGKAIFGDLDPELEDQIFDTDTDTSSASLKLASALDTPTMTEDSALESEPPMLKKRRVHSSAEKSPNLEEQLLALRLAEVLRKTRQRENETKRWSDNETKRMLEYIQSHTKFEKPTARVFYTKLLEETKINTKWHLARCKMRNLRALFLKANACLESTEALDENDNGVVTVLEKVRKICPHYDMLSDIFSHAREAIVEEFDTELEEQNLDTDPDTCSPSFQLASELDAQIVTDDSALESELPKFKRRRVHSSAEKLHNLEEERLALHREHLRHELEKKIRYQIAAVCSFHWFSFLLPIFYLQSSVSHCAVLPSLATPCLLVTVIYQCPV